MPRTPPCGAAERRKSQYLEAVVTMSARRMLQNSGHVRLPRMLTRILPPLAIVLAVFVGCTDEETIFVERPIFNDPPETTNNFLGYFDAAEKQTTCGNCHAGKQAGWEETAHADAWAGLQSSGAAQESCWGCHAISENGNALTDPGGINLVEDEAYFDVQCENCHGSGFEHVQDPDASQPLASALVAVDATNGCGECHSDVHHPFVEEWSQSPHAKPWGQFFAGAGDENCTSCAAARPPEDGCPGCHRGQDVLVRFGENDDYLEKFDEEHLAHTCAVCHDPHELNNEHQLRFPVNTNAVELHLCAQCHDRRPVPDPESSHGLEPHSPEAALLVGDAGWFPPGSDIGTGQIRGTHGSEANEELCATCHLSTFSLNDPETGDFLFSATGHLFRPIPCVDAQGIPQPFEVACDFTVEARNFSGCTGAGCHGDAQAAASALSAATTRIGGLAEDLIAQLALVDPNLEDEGGAIDPNDPIFTVAEGAFFNHALAEFGNPDYNTFSVVGSSVHNPFLIESLLIASIQAVEDEYGIAPPAAPATDWQARLREVLNRVP